MPKPLNPINGKFYDNSGKLVPQEKLEFYLQTNWLDQPSVARYNLHKYNMYHSFKGNFYDKLGNIIPNDELDEYYEQELMNDSSIKKYLHARKLSEDNDDSQD